MIEIIKLFPKWSNHLLLFILPFFLMSCGTPSHNINSSISSNKIDRFQLMVVFVKQAVADNPKFNTVEGKKYTQSLNKFISFLQSQVKAKKITSDRAAVVLSEVFSQFENDNYNYKSAKTLYYEKHYRQINYSPPDKNNPWLPEEEPLM
jgi:hypothetical protein